MAGAYEEIRYVTAGPRATVTLHRPAKLNAITPRMTAEIRAALDEAESDPKVRVVVVAGEGRAFSAGFDLSPRAVPQSSREWRARFGDTNATLSRIWALDKPVVAQVHGACLGAAFDLVMACDLAIASEDATFGEPEIRYGGTCQYLLLPWIAGMKAVKRILLTGDTLGAREAQALQLVNEVVPFDELAPTVDALCGRIAAAPAGTAGMNKRALNRAYELMGVAEAVRASEDLAVIAAMGPSDEATELHALIAERGIGAAREWLDRRTGGQGTAAEPRGSP